MLLFDTHSHFHDVKFDEDRAAAHERAKVAGVELILTLGDCLAACRKAIEISQRHTGVVAAAGIHPSCARSWDDQTAAELEALLDDPAVVVLGEIGIDLYWDKTPDFLAIQERAFREQLRIARRRGLAVSIHSRDANEMVLRILAEEGASEFGGILHCYNGTWEEARRGLDLGFRLGVGGSSTYPKAGDLRDVLKRVGAEHLVLETDAPYLAPQSRRGKRNEPAFVADTARRLAATLGCDPEALAETTWKNGIESLRIPSECIPF